MSPTSTASAGRELWLAGITDAVATVSALPDDDSTMSRPVAACAPWLVGDALWHLIEVHSFWRQVVAEGATPQSVRRTAPPADEELPRMLADGAAALVAALADADPDSAVWTWAGPRHPSWVARRMAHETAVHAFDVCSAAGLGWRIEPSLATDAIDEFLGVMLDQLREGQPRPGGTVHLHCTDVDGEWMVRDVNGTFEVERAHAKGSCALRGTGAELMLVLWRRWPLARVEVIGDGEVAERFVGCADLG